MSQNKVNPKVVAGHMAQKITTFRVEVKKPWGWSGLGDAYFGDRLNAVKAAIRVRRKSGGKIQVRVVTARVQLPRFVANDAPRLGKRVSLWVRNFG